MNQKEKLVLISVKQTQNFVWVCCDNLFVNGKEMFKADNKNVNFPK